MPTEFYVSEKWIRNSVRTLILVLLFYFAFLVYKWAKGYSNVVFTQDLCLAIVMISSIARLHHRHLLVKNNEPIITIGEKSIAFPDTQEFAIVQMEDIKAIELKRWLWRKYLKIHFNKRLDDDRDLIACYNKSLWKNNKERKSCKWFIQGFTVEPEELEQAVNFYLQMFRKRQASYPSTWNIPKFLQGQKRN